MSTPHALVQIAQLATGGCSSLSRALDALEYYDDDFVITITTEAGIQFEAKVRGIRRMVDRTHRVTGYIKRIISGPHQIVGKQMRLEVDFRNRTGRVLLSDDHLGLES